MLFSRGRWAGGGLVFVALADPSLLLSLHQKKQAENQKDHQGDAQDQQAINAAEKISGKTGDDPPNSKVRSSPQT